MRELTIEEISWVSGGSLRLPPSPEELDRRRVERQQQIDQELIDRIMKELRDRFPPSGSCWPSPGTYCV